MSIAAFQTVEEYQQIPVAAEVDVTHVVSCPTVFSGSVAMVRDLVVMLCKKYDKDNNKLLLFLIEVVLFM